MRSLSRTPWSPNEAPLQLFTVLNFNIHACRLCGCAPKIVIIIKVINYDNNGNSITVVVIMRGWLKCSHHWSSRASSDTVSFTFTYHTWQFIISFFTIFTITTCIFSYSSFTLNLRRGSSANHFLHRPFPFLPDRIHGLSDHLMFLFCSTAGFVCMVC